MTLFTVTQRRIDNLKQDASIPIENLGGTSPQLEGQAEDDADVDGRHQRLGQTGPTWRSGSLCQTLSFGSKNYSNAYPLGTQSPWNP